MAAAGAILVLPDGRWVLQRRTPDAPRDPGKLSFFGGMLEPGEKPLEGLRRELREETSLDLTDQKFPIVLEHTSLHYAEPFHFWIFKVKIPNLEFEVYEGTHAEAHTLEELAQNLDELALLAQDVVKILSEEKHGTKHN